LPTEDFIRILYSKIQASEAR